MPKQYGQEAIEEARRLFCKYGGKNYDAIEREMQKKWPSWRKGLLPDKGKGKDARLGWIARYGFDNSLEIHTKTLMTAVADDTQNLYLGIKTVRQKLQLKVVGDSPTKDQLYQYRDYCNLEIAARKALDLTRDNLETFVSGFEKLMIWLADIDPELARGLAKNGDRLVEAAKAHYGEEAALDEGTDPGENEGSEPADAGENGLDNRPGPVDRALKLVEKKVV